MWKYVLPLIFLINETGSAQETNPSQIIDHGVIRRIAIFPIEMDDQYQTEQNKKESDTAWWGVREYLADTQRFFVATKRFMVQKDVFQPLNQLNQPDTLLLGKMLEADCLISIGLNDGRIKMQAHSTLDGFLVWENALKLNPSVPAAKQLTPISMRLIKDFVAALPYQGFQIVDPLIGKPVFEEGDISLAKIDVGARSSIQTGETVQWLEITRQNPKPLFNGGAEIKVIAEGEVVKIENQIALVQIKRVNDIKYLEKKSAVSFPEEYRRLQNQFALSDSLAPKVSTLFLSKPLYPTETTSTQSKPLVTAVTAVLSIVGLLLLAF